MPRNRRPYLPGTAFHVTARTQAKAHWFDESIRDSIVDAINESIHKSDAHPMAFVVMSNHLHLIVQQRHDPLWTLMQPVMVKIALRTKKLAGVQDHVFGNRYFAKPCRDVDHVRRVIAYTHFNPVKARMCEDPAEYRWSSEVAYRSVDTMSHPCLSMPLIGLSLFAPTETASHEETVANYIRFTRMTCIRAAPNSDAGTDAHLPTFTLVQGGDAFWHAELAKPLAAPIPAERRPDLRDIVLRLLALRCPGLSLDDFFVQKCAREIVSVRREMIEQALRAGYRGRTIAQFLRVTDAVVSGVRHRLLVEKRHAQTGQS